MSLLLFYSLLQSLESLTPNHSLHMVYAYPYTPPFVNWTDRYETDLGIVPYALGEKALYRPGVCAGPEYELQCGR
jgi:hypothetical protein